jgi:quercetin dioxygenase-like cupin family protein
MTGLIEQLKVLKPGDYPKIIGNECHYSGAVTLTRLVKSEEPSCMTCALVAFEEGSRTAWHTHPKGQLLIVTEGEGLVQATAAMSHIAIQEELDGRVVDWLEKVRG